jgi:putative acetyltransferase
MNAYQLRQYSRQAVRLLGMLDKQCGDVSLTPVQAHALGEVGLTPITITQLAQNLNVNKSNASRTVSSLIKLNLVKYLDNPRDKRSQLVDVTEQGNQALLQLDRQQNVFFDRLLSSLGEQEQKQVKRGFETYIKGLTKICRSDDFFIRPLSKADNSDVADLIRDVSAEYGLTADKGYSVSDPTLDDLYSVYDQQNSAYWVIEHNGKIVGGGGFSPLSGEPDVCELQKMYFLPQTRGHGLAKRLVALILKQAKDLGYQQCYLETTECLKEAISLYENLGFEYLDSPRGKTGHDACEVIMQKWIE